MSPASIDAEVAGGDASVDVSNGGGGTLSWTASVPGGVAWARISSGSSGSNSGTVELEIDANSGAAREFELTVSASGADSRTVTVRQAEAPAVLEVSAAATQLDGEGGRVAVQVRNTGHATMQWSASLPDDVDWAYIDSGGQGTDAGEIVVRYDVNGGAERELTLTVTAPAATNSPQSATLSQAWFAAAACTWPAARAEVRDLMQTWYYFNDEPDMKARYDGLVLDDHGSIDSLLDALRWKPETHDRGFTYWSTAAETDLVFAGQAFIFGFRGRMVVDLNQAPLYYEVLDVYAGAPAGNAGLARGDRITGLNGKQVSSLTLAQVGEELGPNEDGYEVSFEVEKPSGERRSFSMAKALVDIPTVPEEHVAVFETDAGKAGYLHFRTFFGNANARLLEEFAQFKAAGVSHLIVDLRYNGGGSVPIAYGLATLIGGPELFANPSSTVLARRVHNELVAANQFDTTHYFGCEHYASAELIARCENDASLPNLENVVFITSGGSASASELVITALQPHETVALVGERTYGKPVGQYGLGFCLTVPNVLDSRLGDLWPVTFATVNSVGFEDYYEGLPVTEGCQVEDDLTRRMGDREEGRLAAALRYLETGTCGAPASSGLAAQGLPRLPGPARDPVTHFFGH